MESVLAFVAVPEADTSLDFRELVVKLRVSTEDQFLACLKAALGLPEPTRITATLGVLQDVLESKTSPVQEALFAAVESVENTLGTMLRAPGKEKYRNAILQFLIDLSRGATPVFRARVLRLISIVLPALDRSGLNLRGAIAPPSFSPAEQLQDVATDDAGRLDYVLYGAFYRLQQIVSGGTLAKQFEALSQAVDTVLVAMAACPPLDKSIRKSGKEHAETLAYFRDAEALLAHFTPEFDRDGRFKMQLLVQLAIFLNHVEGQAAKAGAVAAAGAAAEREQQWIKATRKRVFGEVRRICGSQKWLEKILKEDSLWAQWRGDGAKVDAVVLPDSTGGTAAAASALSASRAEAGELPDDTAVAVAAAPQRRKAASGLGNAELSRLWALAATHKLEDDVGADVTCPSYETFLQRVREDADPSNDIEDSYRMCNNAVFEWKTLRSLVEQNASLINLKGVFTSKSPLEALVATLAQSGNGGADAEETTKREGGNDAEAAPAGATDAATAAEPEGKRSRKADNENE